MKQIAVVVVLLCAVQLSSGQFVTVVQDFAVSDVTGALVYRPRVAVHPVDGSFALSWGDERYGASSAGRLAGIGDIMAARFSASGTATTQNFKVGNIAFGFFSDFSLYYSAPLILPSGALVVAYHVDARTTVESIKFDDVYFSWYGADGSAQIVDRQLNRVNNSGSGYAYMPEATQFGADFLVVYRYYINDAYHIGATVVSGSTGTLLGNAAVIDDASSGNRAAPSAASNGARTIVAWSDTRGDARGDVYVQRFTGSQANGGNLKANTDAVGNYNQFPRAAMNAEGQGVVVWIDTRAHPGGDLYAQRYDGSGNPVGGNLKLTASQSVFFEYAPGVAMDGQGNFVVTWSDSLPGAQWSAKTRAFDASGNPLGSITELTSPVSASLQPDVKITPSGACVYTWLDGRLDASHGRIFAKVVSVTPPTAAAAEDRSVTFFLLSNYPNPFNPTTRIRYSIPARGFVSLKVLDALGREIRELAGYQHERGEFTAIFDGTGLPSGIYFSRLSYGTFSRVGKMMLSK